jgi:hypothetical protein
VNPTEELDVKKIEIGTRVAYSVQFLKSIGASHSDMSRGRGKVTGLKPLSPGFVLADIEWEKGADLPARVNVGNLAIVGLNTRFASC